MAVVRKRTMVEIPAVAKANRQVFQIAVVRRRDYADPAWSKQFEECLRKTTRIEAVLNDLQTNDQRECSVFCRKIIISAAMMNMDVRKIPICQHNAGFRLINSDHIET